MRTLTIAIGSMLVALVGPTSDSVQEAAAGGHRTSGRSEVWDGSHVSRSFLDERGEVGPAWEYIGIRGEQASSDGVAIGFPDPPSDM